MRYALLTERNNMTAKGDRDAAVSTWDGGSARSLGTTREPASARPHLGATWPVGRACTDHPSDLACRRATLRTVAAVARFEDGAPKIIDRRGTPIDMRRRERWAGYMPACHRGLIFIG
jgi:hypothetical protein